MADYKHGAYGGLGASILRQPNVCTITPVYVGTAPAHQAQGGSARVNMPIKVATMEEATRLLGYSDDWASYTLCEAMYAHFANGEPVGPIVLINVFDPGAFKAATATTIAGVTFTRAGAVLTDMGAAILDTLEIPGKILGVDFAVQYDAAKETARITALPGKALPATATVSYFQMENVAVAASAVVGARSEVGDSTGVYAVEKAYQATGMIPYVLCAPGWSQNPAVHDAMIDAAQQISGHWYVQCMTDLPLSEDRAGTETGLTIEEVRGWKEANGYSSEFEATHWPMARRNGRVFHLSTLGAVAQMRLDYSNGDVPYESVDNKPLDADAAVLFGGKTAVFGPEVLNNHLTQYGIASLVYWGGTWRYWGAHTAAVAEAVAEDPRALYVANVRMLLYMTNWFQDHFKEEIGRPYTRNRAQSIQAECQAYLDALVGAGALVKGECRLDQGDDPMADVLAGALRFNLLVTNTPPLRSLEAILRYDQTGLELIFPDEDAA